MTQHRKQRNHFIPRLLLNDMVQGGVLQEHYQDLNFFLWCQYTRTKATRDNLAEGIDQAIGLLPQILGTEEFGALLAQKVDDNFCDSNFIDKLFKSDLHSASLFKNIMSVPEQRKTAVQTIVDLLSTVDIQNIGEKFVASARAHNVIPKVLDEHHPSVLKEVLEKKHIPEQMNISFDKCPPGSTTYSGGCLRICCGSGEGGSALIRGIQDVVSNIHAYCIRNGFDSPKGSRANNTFCRPNQRGLCSCVTQIYLLEH